MPTESLSSILDRELSKAEAKEIIETLSPFLQELVNYSTNALARCSGSASAQKDRDTAPLALYRHIIEMTDGIEVLISQSCPIPAIPLLRSSFEAYLSIEYILERDEDYIRRSLSWLVGYIHKRIDAWERLDPSTTKGQQFQPDLDEYKYMPGLRIMSSQDAQDSIAELQSWLAQPHLQPIEAEFRRHRNWYSLFGGPGNLEQLARRLSLGAEYGVLYREWSTTIHAQDLGRFFDTTSTGETAIARIRDPATLKEMTNHASTYILMATKSVLGKFRPGEERSLTEWHKREIEQTFLSTVLPRGAASISRPVLAPKSIGTDMPLAFDFSKIDSVFKIAHSELDNGANGNVIKLVLKALGSELNRFWMLIDAPENQNVDFRQRKLSVEAPDEKLPPDIYYTKRLLLKLQNAAKNLQSETVVTKLQLSILEEGVCLLKAGNLNADVLKDYSTQLRHGELDTMVRPTSDDAVDELISLYMEKLGKGET